MLIIFGLRVFFHTIGEGVFHCQRCGGDRSYRLRRGRRFFCLYFIPIIPLAKAGEHVQCRTCGTRYQPDVLSLPTASQMQAALPAMRAAGQGWIVNLSSASGRLQPGPPFSGVRPEMGVYGASKAALNRITNAVAAEVAGEGVRVNTVEPRAGVLTEGVRALLPEGLGDDQLESLDTMVEAAVALCACAPDLTGRVTVSRDLIEELGLMVRPVAGEGP